MSRISRNGESVPRCAWHYRASTFRGKAAYPAMTVLLLPGTRLDAGFRLSGFREYMLCSVPTRTQTEETAYGNHHGDVALWARASV